MARLTLVSTIAKLSKIAIHTDSSVQTLVLDTSLTHSSSSIASQTSLTQLASLSLHTESVSRTIDA